MQSGRHLDGRLDGVRRANETALALVLRHVTHRLVERAVLAVVGMTLHPAHDREARLIAGFVRVVAVLAGHDQLALQGRDFCAIIQRWLHLRFELRERHAAELRARRRFLPRGGDVIDEVRGLFGTVWHWLSPPLAFRFTAVHKRCDAFCGTGHITHSLYKSRLALSCRACHRRGLQLHSERIAHATTSSIHFASERNSPPSREYLLEKKRDKNLAS